MDVITKPLYTAEVVTTGGRAGRAVSRDGVLDLALARPGAGSATNPEQLFAAGWSACFQSALQHIGRAKGIDTSSSVVSASVTLGNDAEGGFALSARLTVRIPELDLAVARALVEETHRTCPYSRATRGNVEVQVEALGHA